jgi:hypothetical protein
MQSYIPASYIFSYWIFVWTIIYLVAIRLITSHTIRNIAYKFNPTLALLIAFIWTFISWVRMMLRGYSLRRLAKYAGMILAIKIIPLLATYGTWQQDAGIELIILAVIFGIYVLYVQSQGTTFVDAYDELTRSLDNDDNRTPIYYWAAKFS